MSLRENVYRLCKKIPKGKVSTYREIALALDTKAYQAVGQILRTNPDAPRTPCHRVVNSKGELHGFRGKRKGKALKDKATLLQEEGVDVVKGKVDLNKFLHTF